MYPLGGKGWLEKGGSCSSYSNLGFFTLSSFKLKYEFSSAFVALGDFGD